jgi:glycosyltransferase involved in cell wall biosynthesis
VPEIATELGINRKVIYPEKLWDAWHGVQFESLVRLYNAADIFVSPSGGEGWNLPLSEAAACGCPCACTTYSGMWDQAHEYAIPMEPFDWLTHSTGLELACVSPQLIADTIEHYAITHREDAIPFVKRGLEIAKTRSWDTLKVEIAKLVSEVLK